MDNTEQEVVDVAAVLGLTRTEALEWLSRPVEGQGNAAGHAGAGTQAKPKQRLTMTDLIRRMAGRG